jgi:hypothetical protein
MGALITLAGFFLDLRDMLVLGIPPQGWQAIGALIVFLGVAAMLLEIHKRVEEGHGNSRTPPADLRRQMNVAASAAGVSAKSNETVSESPRPIGAPAVSAEAGRESAISHLNRNESGQERLRELYALARPAIAQGIQLLGEAIDTVSNHSAEGYWLALFVNQHVRESSQSALNSMDECIDSTQAFEEIQARFAELFDRYISLRQWIIRASSLSGWDVLSTDSYSRWQKAEGEFLADLAKSVKRKDLAVFADRIRIIQTIRGGLESLPAPASGTEFRRK